MLTGDALDKALRVLDARGAPGDKSRVERIKGPIFIRRDTTNSKRVYFRSNRPRKKEPPTMGWSNPSKC